MSKLTAQADSPLAQFAAQLQATDDLAAITIELPLLRSDIETLLRQRATLAAALQQLVGDPKRSGIIHAEAESCAYCRYSPYEDEDIDIDEIDTADPQLRRHADDCPILHGRALLAGMA